MNKTKKNLNLFVVGLIAGAISTVSLGLIFYKVRKYQQSPKRYITDKNPLKDDCEIQVASSLDRIFKDGNTLLEPIFTNTASISLARNEYESFQIIVRSGNKTLESVQLEATDLISQDGKSLIDSQHITWRVVGYVQTLKPYYPVKYIGLWPDPLLPAQPTDIAPRTTQSFWVTLYTPEGTQAGFYQGKVIVRIQGTIAKEIPLKARVYDFSLTKENRLKTAFDFYSHITKIRYPQMKMESEEEYHLRLEAINEKYIMAMLKYRLNPVLNVNPTDEIELGKVDKYLLMGLNNFSIGKRGGTFNNNWPSNDKDIEALLPEYRTYGEILNLNGLLPYHYIYTWDEGKIGKPQVAKICAMIHKAYPGLKNMVAYHGFWDPIKNPAWGKDIDIWCFQVDNFDEKRIQQLRRIGKEVWMYISGPSGYGSPNLAIDFDSIDYRIIPWLCWKFDIEGFLYWCVNWWPKADPFKIAKNTKWGQNGNGLLFYPGENGPIASLRLEIFRDGMEDFAYIQMLLQKIKKIKDAHLQDGKNLFQQSIELLTVDKTIATSMFRFTKDKRVLFHRRDAIAEKIEEVDKFLQSFE